jgi:tetratricopeptide (TPR) repeat protein
MSLITDLLSRVKQREPRRDIPPILKDAVFKSTTERQTRKRLATVLLITLVFIGAGFGAVFLMEYLKEPPSAVRAPVATTPAFEPASKSASSALQAQPKAEEIAAASKTQNATETAVKPKLGGASLDHPRRKKTITKKYVEGIGQEASGSMNEMGREKASGEELPASTKPARGLIRDDKDFALYTARTYEMQKKYHQAVSHYKDVLAMEPNNYAVMNNISSMLIHLGSYEESMRYAQRALNIRKDYVPSLVNMGIDYSCLGKISESESYFRRALTIEPANRYALLNLAVLYEKQSAFDKADQYYARLSQEGDAQGYLGSARIAEKQNRIADAIHFYRMVKSTETADPQASNTASDRLMRLTK